jgi:hypothetical protein
MKRMTCKVWHLLMGHLYVEITEMLDKYYLGSNSQYMYYWLTMDKKHRKNDIYSRNNKEIF